MQLGGSLDQLKGAHPILQVVTGFLQAINILALADLSSTWSALCLVEV